MKHVLIGLLVSICLFSMTPTASAERNTPYPPPPQSQSDDRTTPENGGYGAAASGAEMGADLVLVRPLSLGAFFIGFGLAIVATPFAVITGTVDPVYNKLVGEPFNFALRRPLGEF